MKYMSPYTTHSSMSMKKTVLKSDMKNRHKKCKSTRSMSAPNFFAQHLFDQCDYLVKQGYVHRNSDMNQKVAVIIEPREHVHLQSVLYNVMHLLGPSWNLHLWTTEKTDAWIRQRLQGWEFRTTILGVENLPTQLYNILLKDAQFWWAIPEETILIFQTDCIMFHGNIEPWLAYDYCGANYYELNAIAPGVGGIQGGFSIRSRKCMLECIWNVPQRSILHQHPKISELKEDIFFTHACARLGKKVPPICDRKRFSIEAEAYPYPMAHHGFHKKYVSSELSEIILASCQCALCRSLAHAEVAQ